MILCCHSHKQQLNLLAHIHQLLEHRPSTDTMVLSQPIRQATGTIVQHTAIAVNPSNTISCCCLYTYREPCHAVPPVVSPSRVTSYLQGQGAPSCSTRHHMHLALNWSAQCTCSLGAVTLRARISPRTASSASINPLGTQPQMTWTQQRMGMSTPGLLTLHRRIRSSRYSSASSLS